jgi:dihydrofolate synthase / folylpolyglutamate synthase
MRFTTETDAVTYIFTSLANSNWRARGLDEVTRDTEPTRHLLALHGLPSAQREYAVVTGSKGKGSVTTLTARILRELGHTVGTITSPHLIGYRERIRINGKAIPQADFLRLVDYFAPGIDAITGELPEGKYLSPQGIFLAMALKWFDENNAGAAVIEVGRGGRFDDNALVPNYLSLFTPIVLEHTRYMGPTVERIAWHKAGILKPDGYGLSLPQSDEAAEQLRAEAQTVGAILRFLLEDQMGRYVRDWDGGVTMVMPDGMQIDLPFYGRYEIDNATLSLEAAHIMNERIRGTVPADYMAKAKAALEAAQWPGRCEKLAESPAIYIDGAVNPLSLRVYLESIEGRITPPVVVVAAVPSDRNIEATYAMLAKRADHLILTASPRNITISFPDEATATAAAQKALNEIGRHIPVEYAPTIADAIQKAQRAAGTSGTVVMAVAQPAIGDAMEYFGRVFEQL